MFWVQKSVLYDFIVEALVSRGNILKQTGWYSCCITVNYVSIRQQSWTCRKPEFYLTFKPQLLCAAQKYTVFQFYAWSSKAGA